MNKEGRISKIFTNQIFFLTILIFILGAVATIFNPRFLSIQNLMNILQQNSILAIVSIGAALVMISGNFDISVGYMVSLATTVISVLIYNGFNTLFATTTGFLICILCGLFNGLIIAKTRTPSFIITLASMSIFYGASLIVTGGASHSMGGKFVFLGRGNLFGVIPMPIVIMVVIFIIIYLLLRFTKLGRRIYAIGGNEAAAYLSGVDTDTIKIIIYIINGALVGIASLVLVSKLGSAQPTTGQGIELKAIAAVVIGGVPLTGGKGTALGTFLGVILTGLISNILNILNISAYYQQIVLGIIIIIAVIVSNIGGIKRK
ncbi:MAG: ABC transporter permease [Actinomycetota bacterium]|nr:ABC transporter permease [Actinomycetota bacterium]